LIWFLMPCYRQFCSILKHMINSEDFISVISKLIIKTYDHLVLKASVNESVNIEKKTS